MDERKRSRLEEAGVNVEDVLARFMNNEALMLKFLLRFPQDPNFALLQEAMARQDLQGAYNAAHTLKGVAGNLSMTGLMAAVSAVVEDLRGGDLAAAADKLPALTEQYHKTVAAVTEAAQIP
ncbi:Hpt domain-containing protein [Pseudoflavonifractor phocaeensis]|uniref:Hpt domain-containing protein n=1 Tax=Pseudoflavonifractor phocaeensis TaxID=1870988 RepID=UPI00195D734D|nr:Hpt domain-containing protein [Pseudoflavonifractor phocaeensis]MBM6924732.1 Hpt domain-containing protein [Pseudoflavonifractor phocaeensis]